MTTKRTQWTWKGIVLGTPAKRPCGCTHPYTWHRLTRLSPPWRNAFALYLVAKFAFIAYLLHPLAHTALRVLGVPCP